MVCDHSENSGETATLSMAENRWLEPNQNGANGTRASSQMLLEPEATEVMMMMTMMMMVVVIFEVSMTLWLLWL